MPALLKNPLAGELRGGMKMTPEQAERMFGFSMREDAQGVLFRKYRLITGKYMIFINNLVYPSNPRTAKQQLWRRMFAWCVKLAKNYTELAESEDEYLYWKTLSKYLSYASIIYRAIISYWEGT